MPRCSTRPALREPVIRDPADSYVTRDRAGRLAGDGEQGHRPSWTDGLAIDQSGHDSGPAALLEPGKKAVSAGLIR
jgi:hypothetical protein